MIRIIAFLLAVAVAALAAAWLVERPGDVAINWLGWRIETSVTVAVAVIAIVAVLMALIWSAVRFVLRSPRLLSRALRARKHRRGRHALSKGLVAVACGDTTGAQKFANQAERLAPSEPLTLLLRAQAAQLAGDRGAADVAFRSMTERPETHLLGLRGLYIEAQRRGDAEAAMGYAEAAARRAPALSWAGQATFEFRCASRDWSGALEALETNRRSGLIDRQTYRRHRAVLLTARAIESEDFDPAAARALALDAVKLAPDLVPAAALAARLAAEGGEWRRAAKLVEAAWRHNPHPDLAEIYAYLRSGDTARDRLARLRQLARRRPGEREAALAIARTALAARDFAAARAALAPLVATPTQRSAMLMAELEEAEHGDLGRAREWMARALRAERDPAWAADGIVSDRWLPVSPLSGRLDAFEWKVPLAEIGPAAAPPPQERAPRPFATLAAELPPHDGAADSTPTPSAEEARPNAEPTAASDSDHRNTEPPSPPPRIASAPSAAPVGDARRKDAVIPLLHAPDDPGPDAEADTATRSGDQRHLPATFS